MVGVIVGSKKTGINPDNVATPIAASFGDLITLAILAWISQGLYNCLARSHLGNKTANNGAASLERSMITRPLMGGESVIHHTAEEANQVLNPS
ncbi:hypothetical protein cypCar_00000140 [Cyprinus carpio]|nr:hypothetical protein cypCar_00000140 [Cyprinus carpio]